MGNCISCLLLSKRGKLKINDSTNYMAQMYAIQKSDKNKSKSKKSKSLQLLYKTDKK